VDINLIITIMSYFCISVLAAVLVQVFQSVTLVPASWEVGSIENPKVPYLPIVVNPGRDSGWSNRFRVSCAVTALRRQLRDQWAGCIRIQSWSEPRVMCTEAMMLCLRNKDSDFSSQYVDSAMSVAVRSIQFELNRWTIPPGSTLVTT
jgi:hypothetical protein